MYIFIYLYIVITGNRLEIDTLKIIMFRISNLNYTMAKCSYVVITGLAK